MEVKIGVRQAPRELTLDTDLDKEEVTKRARTAIENNTLFEIQDSKNRYILVPGSAIGYLEVGDEQQRRVGFGLS